MSSLFYHYRIFLSSGNALHVYRPEKNELKLWETVVELKYKEEPSEGFSYFYLDKDHNIIPGVVDPNVIIVIDRPFGNEPIDLDILKKQIDEAKEKALRTQIRTKMGSIDITPRE
jgi:hypothetical protein